MWGREHGFNLTYITMRIKEEERRMSGRGKLGIIEEKSSDSTASCELPRGSTYSGVRSLLIIEVRKLSGKSRRERVERECENHRCASRALRPKDFEGRKWNGNYLEGVLSPFFREDSGSKNRMWGDVEFCGRRRMRKKRWTWGGSKVRERSGGGRDGNDGRSKEDCG